MKPLLEIKGLEKSFTVHHLEKTTTALKGIELRIHEGEFLGIVGKSGSGKSTIIKCIYGTYKPDRGQILYHSEAFGTVDLASLSARRMLFLRRQEIGYVSQFLNVMPRTGCLRLVIDSLREVGVDEETAVREAKAVLEHFNLSESLWEHYPNTFSGGEKLRLNIACAVVKRPRLLLLDEPTASLDNESKLAVRSAIEKLKANGTTMIGIFHDLEFMNGLCDNRYIMNSQHGSMTC